MEISQVSSIFVALAIYALAVPIPGPSMVAISRTSVAGGSAAGASTAFGTTLGVCTYAVATLFGLGALLAALPWMLALIQVAGGAYLIYLGLVLIRAHIRSRSISAVDDGSLEGRAEPPPRISQAFIRGLLVSIGNPKMAAFFFGLYAPLVGASNTMTAQIAVLAGVLLIDLIYHQALARAVSLASSSFARSSIRRWLDAVAGGLMTVFGVGLLVNALTR